MSFIELDINSQLLNELRLPEQLDEKHPYRYRVFRHNDGSAIFIKRSYSHYHESFQDMELWLDDDKYIIKEIVKITALGDSWSYLLTDLIAYAPTNSSEKQKKIKYYMSEILQTYGRGKYDLRISDSINLNLNNTQLGGKFISLS